MARILGSDARKISAAMQIAGMEGAAASVGMARNSRNISAWQILALVEAGLLDMPDKVSKAS